MMTTVSIKRLWVFLLVVLPLTLFLWHASARTVMLPHEWTLEEPDYTSATSYPTVITSKIGHIPANVILQDLISIPEDPYNLDKDRDTQKQDLIQLLPYLFVIGDIPPEERDNFLVNHFTVTHLGLNDQHSDVPILSINYTFNYDWFTTPQYLSIKLGRKIETYDHRSAKWSTTYNIETYDQHAAERYAAYQNGLDSIVPEEKVLRRFKQQFPLERMSSLSDDQLSLLVRNGKLIPGAETSNSGILFHRHCPRKLQSEYLQYSFKACSMDLRTGNLDCSLGRRDCAINSEF